MFIHTFLAKGKASFALLLLFVSIAVPVNVLAQERTNAKNAQASLEALEALVASSERPASFTTHRLQDGRIQAGKNIMRSMYRIEEAMSSSFSGAPGEVSDAFLRQYAFQLGLDSELADVEKVREVSTQYSHHITYQQVHQGVPVYSRYVKVNMNADGAVTMVLNGYATDISRAFDEDVSPRISSQAAVASVGDFIDLPIDNVGEAELMIYPSASPRLVWRFLVWTASPSLELELFVDAKDGRFVAAIHTSTHAHELEEAGEIHAQHNHAPSTQNMARLGQVTGTGLVFDPDPLSSSGSDYGPPFVDNDDTDVVAVNQERKLINLLDISQGGDGLYRLIGPHVQITGETAGGTQVYLPPAEDSPDGFRYLRSNAFFESVNVYYHVDKSQRYIQSLNLGRDIQNTSIEINPHGLLQEDNSRYFSGRNFIAFGLGGVDDAEDGHVIWHEYGHALLDDSAPGLLSYNEGKALHEGWADYWAGSYARSLVEDNQSARTDWTYLFKWDSGDGAIWAGRQLTAEGRYPEDVFCDDGGFLCDIYEDGLFWATTLMQIYDVLGRTQTDRLALASHVYLSSPVNFQDAAEAIIQADIDLNNGENVQFLVDLLSEKGLVSSSDFGPVVIHEPPMATEQLGGTLPLFVEANGISSSVDQVFVVYTHPGSAADTLFFELESNDTYTVLLPLPDVSGEVSYYIGVLDQAGALTRNPSGAPVSQYRFQVGPDLVPPLISHVQLETISLTEWPATVEARVEDNLGIDTVSVDFYIDNPFGVRVAEGVFLLEEKSSAVFEGAFPTSLDELAPASTVFYRIVATDSAQESNEALSPESGFHSFNIVIENGLFRSYNFEEELSNFSSIGIWEREAPEFGLRVAHSGTFAWGTSPSGAYPDIAQQSTLELPAMNLTGIENAYLVFWHWHDTEHAGQATPGGDDSAVLWDGGNVKVSSDGGITWQVASPQGGYNGRIASGRENPLEGEPAFGGFSYGWRQVVVPVPAGNMLLIRFDFGTDAGSGKTNSGKAGWFIDDVQVLTELDSDTVDPLFLRLIEPESTIIRRVGEPIPDPTVEVLDDIGIESVFLDYVLSNAGSEIERGRSRLAMDSTEIYLYYGGLPFSEVSASVGDILEYSFTISDFAGNTIVFPAPTQDPFRVEFRLIGEQDLISSAAPTGLWQAESDALVLRQRDYYESISSLVFGPIELPLNADQIELEIFSTYEIGDSRGGNIKLALEDANDWTLIEPVGGYNDVLADDESVPESMRGQPVFSGTQEDVQQTTFLLESFAGNQVWIRADFAADTLLSQTENWEIQDMVVRYSTLEPQNGGFAVERTFTLYENFPDPFSGTTTIGYTLENASPVRLEVYDVLGRLVETLVSGDQAAGTYTLSFDGSRLSSGVYFLRLVTNQGQEIEKMLISK